GQRDGDEAVGVGRWRDRDRAKGATPAEHDVAVWHLPRDRGGGADLEPVGIPAWADHVERERPGRGVLVDRLVGNVADQQGQGVDRLRVANRGDDRAANGLAAGRGARPESDRREADRVRWRAGRVECDWAIKDGGAAVV